MASALEADVPPGIEGSNPSPIEKRQGEYALGAFFCPQLDFLCRSR
jgi:hypothetical protein